MYTKINRFRVPRFTSRVALGAVLTLTLAAPATLAHATTGITENQEVAAVATAEEVTVETMTPAAEPTPAPAEAEAPVDPAPAPQPAPEPATPVELVETKEPAPAPEQPAQEPVAEPNAEEEPEQQEPANQADASAEGSNPNTQLSFGTRDFIFTVADDTGASVSGAVIEFYTLSGEYAGKTGLAGALGVAYVNDVQPGTYYIKIEAPAARQDLVRTEWWLNAATIGEATPVTVTAGAEMGYTVELNTKTTIAQGSIVGTVLDASGRPIPRASVILEHNNGTFPNYMHQTFANDEGEYRFTGIALDDWAVKASRAGYASGYYGSTNGQYVEGVTLTAATPAASGIDIVLAAEGITIAGAVYSGHHGAIVNSGRVFLRAEPGGEVLAEELIQYDGRYRFEQVPPSASYYVSAIGGGSNSYLAEGWWQAGTGEPAPIVVTDNPNQAFTADIELPIRPVIPADDSYSTSPEQPLTVSDATLGVLANDDGAPTLTAELVDAPGNGQVQLHSDGTFAYTPAPGFIGVDSFTYRAEGPYAAAADLGTVRITVENDSDNGGDDGDGDSGDDDTDHPTSDDGNEDSGGEGDGSNGSSSSGSGREGGDSLATTGSGTELGLGAALAVALLTAGGVMLAGRQSRRASGLRR